MKLFSWLDKLKEREKLMIGAAVIVLFAWGVKVVVVQRILKHIDWLDGNDGRIRIEQKQVDKYEGVLERKDSILTSFEKESALVVQAASDSEAQRKIKGEVDALLAGVGITDYRSLDAQDPVDKAFYKEFPVRVVDFEADMTRLLTLLDRVVEMRKRRGMTRVAELTVTVIPGPDATKLKGTLVLSQIVTVAETDAGAEAETETE